MLVHNGALAYLLILDGNSEIVAHVMEQSPLFDMLKAFD